jgi:hypothetical protein
MTYFRVSNETRNASTRALTNTRTIVGTLAALLGIFALWILIAELVSPELSYFPSNSDEANAMHAVQGSAAAAAEIGVVRGDLWAAAVITAATPSLFGTQDGPSGQTSPAEIEDMRAIAERAARLSPLDSRIWLVLAGLDFRVDKNNPKGTDTLKLSYYTGPNEISLTPLRLSLAVRTDAISDDEVQSLVALDIQRIFVQRPDLKPAVALAYSNAAPKGREVIEAALKAVDPSFLKTIAVPHLGNQIPN